MTAHSPATTHSSTEVPSGAHGAFPPFASDTFASQLLWFAITFGLLYYLMSKVALPRVAHVLEERRRKLAQDLEDAHRLKAQSEAAAEAHEKALAEARNRAKGIAQETRNNLAAESETKRKALEAELGGKLAEAEATIRARTAEAMGNVRGIAADTAAAIVERLIGRTPDRSAVEAALDRTLRS
jgi:F-type H+-transporting ATPase subunit b